MNDDGRRRILGTAAIAFSLLYFATDAVEPIQGGFSSWQLVLTFIAEAAVPFLVVGLAAVQRPRLGWLGEAGAIAYACAYVLFVFTVLYALVAGTSDFTTLSDELGAIMVAGGAVMVLAGLAFGADTLRAGVFPRWPAISLMVGVVAVVATQSAPEGLQLLAVGLRDAGFAGMGLALLQGRTGAVARPHPISTPTGSGRLAT